MFSSARHIALGMLVGMSAAALVAMALYFSAATQSPFDLLPIASTTTAAQLSFTPTIFPSATPTTSPTPTFTPVPTLMHIQIATAIITPTTTSTPDVVQNAIDTGALAFAGPLTNAQQIDLYRSSLAYVQTTVEGSRSISKEINGVGYGDPTNICGPLAIAILRDAQLVTTDLTPHDFWLLNPSASTDARLLEKAFPWEQFSHVIIATPINKMDWRASPLLPGDFLFIWHGSGGNFDHMLVVSRVDSSARVYAVTNYGTPEGFVIAEALLYDPNDPSVGLFHQWTRERDAILGSTGFGGFELWRRRTP